MTTTPLDRMIRIGTMAGKAKKTAPYVKAILPLGFECFQLNFWRTLDGMDLRQLADEVRPAVEKSSAIVSCLGVYGNPLGTEELDLQTVRAWEAAIDAAGDFGCGLVCGFSGRVRGKPVPESLPRLREIWLPLLERAGAHGVRIAFENCPMRGGNWQTGDWNIAINPDAWELIFDALPAPHLGLEWEPAHQLEQLIDPLPQLRQWVSKVFHVHGKDASVYRDVLATRGISGPKAYVEHRHPGFGDTDWTALISMLRAADYRGTIDIEGWHDPVYKDELEMTGQVHAMQYLKRCRGGDFVPNPEV